MLARPQLGALCAVQCRERESIVVYSVYKSWSGGCFGVRMEGVTGDESFLAGGM